MNNKNSILDNVVEFECFDRFCNIDHMIPAGGGADLERVLLV